MYMIQQKKAARGSSMSAVCKNTDTRVVGWQDSSTVFMISKLGSPYIMSKCRRRESRKWYKKLYLGIFGIALTNAFILSSKISSNCATVTLEELTLDINSRRTRCK
jgi:hypothetical protein